VTRILFAVAIAGIFLVSAASFATQGDSWVGKKIMTKRDGIEFGNIDPKGGLVNVKQITDMVLVVLAEKDGMLKVQQRGVEGWLMKANAVLLENAVAFFTAEIKTNPNDAAAYNGRAEAWRATGKPEEALKDLNEAIRLTPNDARAWYNRGNIYKDTRENDKAIHDYNEAIRLDPKLFPAYLNRGVAYSNKKDFIKAISDYDEAIRLDPKYSKAYNNRGFSYFDCARCSFSV